MNVAAGAAPDGRAGMAAYVRLLVRTVPGRGSAALALLVAATVTEGAGVLLLLPLLTLVGVPVDSGAAGQLQRAVLDAFRRAGVPPTVPVVLGVYVGIVTARALLQRAAALSTAALQEELLVRLRMRLHEAGTHARWLHVVRSDPAELRYALTSQLEHIGGLAYQLLLLATQLGMAAVYVAIALRLSPAMTIASLASGGILLALLRDMRRRARTAGERVNAVTAGLFATTQEHVAALRTIRTHGAEPRAAERFARTTVAVADANLEAARSYVDARAAFEIGSALLLAGAVWAAVTRFAIAPATLLLLLFLVARLVPQLSGIHGTLQTVRLMLPSFESVMRLIERWEGQAEPPSAGQAPLALRDGIALRGVAFRYREHRDAAVLASVDLDVPAGGMTALVGASGGGKSTLADIVMGLLVPDAGTVLVDGVPLDRARLAVWRSQVAYVAQEPFLFNDSVRANLQWGCADASDAEMWDALRCAAADHVVRALPRGLDSPVGDRGALLSSGERQRIALARALLRRPALLVLDEATSGVDSVQEASIREALAGMRRRVTLLVITHRLSLARDADVIHVLDAGTIVERGTWRDLLRLGGHFAGLCAQQGIAADADAAALALTAERRSVPAT